MVVLITENIEEGSRTAARLVVQAVNNNPALRLGLAAGNTPTGLYRNLVDLHRSERLDFSRVEIFSLDEFLGLATNSANSFHTFYHQHLLNHVNIDPTHLHLLNGQTEKDIASYCSYYEQLIRDNGGIDLQILGIGRNGHLGFNEPGSSLNSRTRISLLSASTRRGMARLFTQAHVPEWAVTMGLGTILEARVLLLSRRRTPQRLNPRFFHSITSHLNSRPHLRHSFSPASIDEPLTKRSEKFHTGGLNCGKA